MDEEWSNSTSSPEILVSKAVLQYKAPGLLREMADCRTGAGNVQDEFTFKFLLFSSSFISDLIFMIFFLLIFSFVFLLSLAALGVGLGSLLRFFLLL